LHKPTAHSAFTKVYDVLRHDAKDLWDLHQRLRGLDGTLPVLVSDFVDGDSLAERHGEATDPILFLERVFAYQAVDALAFLNGLGFRHGDIRPANLKIDRADHVRILDYSLTARVPAPPVPNLAPQYRAPEELKSPPQATTVKADLYALGLVLYEQIFDTVPDPSHRGADIPVEVSTLGYSEEFEQLLKTLLRADPEQRLQAFDRNRWLGTDPPPRAPRVRWRRLAAGALIASATALAGYAIVYSLTSTSPAPPQNQPANDGPGLQDVNLRD
jgi:serine/threonine protein kinase